eukprot:359768-Chlamydomonas_euryale.AAC.11
MRQSRRMVPRHDPSQITRGQRAPGRSCSRRARAGRCRTAPSHPSPNGRPVTVSRIVLVSWVVCVTAALTCSCVAKGGRRGPDGRAAPPSAVRGGCSIVARIVQRGRCVFRAGPRGAREERAVRGA